jgi:hypothetical protein
MVYYFTNFLPKILKILKKILSSNYLNNLFLYNFYILNNENDLKNGYFSIKLYFYNL